MMKRYSFSLRNMVGDLYFRPSARKIAGLDWYPSKSWLHKWLRGLPLDMPDELILRTAGEDAFGTLSVDSSHHRHVLTENAKHGKVWVHDTVKHHALVSPGGRVEASVVAKGTTGDSPILVQLCAKTPKGCAGRCCLLLRGELQDCQIGGMRPLLSTQIQPFGKGHGYVGGHDTLA